LSFFQNDQDDSTIKLADFGFAKRVTGAKSLSTLCGTAQYVAPEILDFQVNGYDEKCDMWSVGVVTYILLGGYAPFEGPADELAQFIIRGDYEFHDKYWTDISESAKDMIAHMLEVDPENRLTAEGALQCEWMGLDSEQLASRDLGGAKNQMEEQKTKLRTDNGAKKALQALIKTNKFLSLGGMGKAKDGEEAEESPKIEATAEDDFEDCYDWGRQIGIGTFSVIHEAVHYDTKANFAVKRIPRVDLWEEDAVALQSEISCLKMATDCSCIVQLHEVFDEVDFTYMVLERLMGGYLIDKIIEKECYDEPEGLNVAKRLIAGVAHCHSRRIAIRDLKPENVLLVRVFAFGFLLNLTSPPLTFLPSFFTPRRWKEVRPKLRSQILATLKRCCNQTHLLRFVVRKVSSHLKLLNTIPSMTLSVMFGV
jgi:serine/threonine protein kinase